MKRIEVIEACLLLGAVCPAIAGGETFETLLNKVPASANAVVLIDVEQTLSTPLAQKEGWGKKLEAAYASRPIFLPPEAKRLVMASDLQAGSNFQPRWELAVMDLSSPVPMRTVARNEGGYTDTLSDTDVVWTPSDAYFVFFGAQQLGAMFPADRQLVSRWIKFAKQNDQNGLSDYLSAVTHDQRAQVQMLLAVDLSDVIMPHELDAKIQASALFKEANLSSEELIPLLTSLRGAALRVAVGNDAQALLKIDFAQDVSRLEPVAHDLVLQVLGNLGASVADIESWKTKVDGHAIMMQGPLSQDGMRRVFSVVNLPSAKFSMLKDEQEAGTANDESLMRESSLTYFRSINSLLKDLKRELGGNVAAAAVMESYARRIDRMPILHVDDDLLDYGTNVAQTLRAIALAKRQGGIQYGVNTAGMGGEGYNDYSYSYGYFGNQGDRYAGARQSAADRASRRASAMASSSNMRVEGAKLIADATAEMRRAMTKKYNTEF
jgi:hypothetical protein